MLQDADNKLYPEVISPKLILSEGKKKRVLVNAFERNSIARSLCVNHYKAQCIVCGFGFKEKYGEIGTGFIHVHHLIELSSIDKEYKVNPITDLRPVCPNCHAMLHQQNPAFPIEELRKIIVNKA
ncbi:MAG TPA: restriction endonuclease [Nitrospiraceae bacterium]|nr:restriction endonuclease [Nitrospiraceae bacterium]